MLKNDKLRDSHEEFESDILQFSLTHDAVKLGGITPKQANMIKAESTPQREGQILAFSTRIKMNVVDQYNQG